MTKKSMDTNDFFWGFFSLSRIRSDADRNIIATNSLAPKLKEQLQRHRRMRVIFSAFFFFFVGLLIRFMLSRHGWLLQVQQSSENPNSGALFCGISHFPAGLNIRFLQVEDLEPVRVFVPVRPGDPYTDRRLRPGIRKTSSFAIGRNRLFTFTETPERRALYRPVFGIEVDLHRMDSCELRGWKLRFSRLLLHFRRSNDSRLFFSYEIVHWKCITVSISARQ